MNSPDNSNSSELVLKKNELTRKMRALEAAYTSGKISQSTYEYLKKDFDEVLIDTEANVRIITVKDEEPSIQPVIGDAVKSESSSPASLEAAREIGESMIIEEPTRGFLDKKVVPEKGFHFYEEIGKPTGHIALSLEDFAEKIRIVPHVSLDFHQKRGDFANWIRNALNEFSLAETVERLEERGESLRNRIMEIIEGPEQRRVFPCPNCGEEVHPKKTWNMPGRPTKAGKRLYLTLGHYKCPNCEKSFRQVLAKQLI